MILKLREHQQLRPIGGHHLIAHSIRFEGDTLDEVVRKVTDYRLNNMKPVGDPKQEVLMYYLRNWPFMVDEDEGALPPDPVKENTEAWVNWVRRQWMKPAVKMITAKEAESRWNVCLKCPFNTPIEALTEEQSDIKRKAFLLRKGNDVPAKLGFCSLHRIDLTVSCFIENVNPLICPNENRSAIPSYCWIKPS